VLLLLHMAVLLVLLLLHAASPGAHAKAKVAALLAFQVLRNLPRSSPGAHHCPAIKLAPAKQQ
jgi:hypothetical protein